MPAKKVRVHKATASALRRRGIDGIMSLSAGSRRECFRGSSGLINRGVLSNTQRAVCGIRPLHLPIPGSCLSFGRETHASTTQSDPVLLPARNGPCREDGALHWEDLF